MLILTDASVASVFPHLLLLLLLLSYPPLAAEIYSEVEQQEWFVDTGVVEAPKGWGVLVCHDPIRLEILKLP